MGKITSSIIVSFALQLDPDTLLFFVHKLEPQLAKLGPVTFKKKRFHINNGTTVDKEIAYLNDTQIVLLVTLFGDSIDPEARHALLYNKHLLSLEMPVEVGWLN